MEQIKLHLCSGIRDFGSEWIHIDKADFSHIQYKDVTDLSQFEDNSVDVIYCCHGISYFDRLEIVPIFKEWFRVLKKGGILRIATPDCRAMMTLYLKELYPLSTFTGPLYGRWSINNETHYHKTTWDYTELKQCLVDIGFEFKNINPYDWRTTEHSHIDDHSMAHIPHMAKETGTLISLNIEAIK